MLTLLFVVTLIKFVISISWYKNFGTAIDNSECVEEKQPIVEYYKIDDYQYMFFSERVSWDEAQTICPIYDGQLAIVNTAEKAYKLAAAISESNIDMEDIWIGGQRSDKGNWTWLNDESIPMEPTAGFPPWVRTPNRPWKQCVAMDRYTVDIPLFVDLDCRLPKPFICQRDVDAPANPDVTLPSHAVKAGKSTYILYHSRISWATAAAFCRMRGYRLAIIPNNKVAKIVATGMVRSRPSFENAWISGHFIHKKWRWLSTGEGMLSYPNENNYPPWHFNSTNRTSGCVLLDRHICDNPVFLAVKCDRKRDFICEKYEKSIKHNVKPGPIKILYKNWTMILNMKELSWYDAQKYCYEENAFLTEVYEYGMMKAITTIMSDQESEPIHVWLGGMFVNGKWIWVESNKSIPISIQESGFMKWCDIEEIDNNNCLNMDREAHDKPVVYGLKCKLKQPFVCTKFSATFPRITTTKGTLPITKKSTTTSTQPTTRKTTTPITTTATRTTPSTPQTTTIKIITLITKPSTTTKPLTTSTTTKPSTTKPPTTSTTTKPLTTSTTTKPSTTEAPTTIEPLTTSTTTKPSTTKPRTTSTTTNPPTTSITTKPSTTVTVNKSTTKTAVKTTTSARPQQKFIECNQIPVVTEVRKDSKKVYISFLTNVTYAEANTSCIKAGGYLARVLGREKKIITKDLKQYTNKCAHEHLSNIWISTKEFEKCTYLNYVTDKALQSATCSESKGYLCDINCQNPTFNHSMFNNNIWNCTPEANNVICGVSCKEGSVLEGTSILMCSSARWVNIYNRTTQLPVCKSENEVTTDLMNWIQQFYTKEYRILYVVDEAITITTEQWWKQLQFIAGLIQAFPLSERSPFGLIIHHNKARTVIPFNFTDTCEVLELFHKLRPDPNAQLSFYEPALKRALEEIETYQKYEKVVMFFFATTPNAGDEYQEILSKLKQKHIIFTIGITEEPKDDLLFMGSTVNETFLSYNFNDFKSFAKVAFGFMDYRSKHLDCPERLYTLPKDSLCHQDSISIYNNGVTYTAFFNKKSFDNAAIKCVDAGGELASFQGRDLKVIVNNIMKEAKSCAAIELWIASPKAPCTSIAISHKREQSDVLDCSLRHGEICQIFCATYPKLSKYANNIWNCSQTPDGHMCYVECKGDSIMRGSDTVMCTQRGWVVNTNMQITYFPICFDDTQVIQRFATAAKDLIQETDGYIFVIDVSSLTTNSNWIPLQIVITMLNVFPISSGYPMGLIIFHKEAEVLVPYKATNACKALQQIQTLKFQTPPASDSYSAYAKALKEVRNQILTLQPRRRTIIFFVSDRNNRGETYEEIITELRNRHVLFAVGINKHSIKDLNSLASMYNDKLLMYKFNHHKSYNEVFKKLQSENSKLKC